MASRPAQHLAPEAPHVRDGPASPANQRIPGGGICADAVYLSQQQPTKQDREVTI